MTLMIFIFIINWYIYGSLARLEENVEVGMPFVE